MHKIRRFLGGAWRGISAVGAALTRNDVPDKVVSIGVIGYGVTLEFGLPAALIAMGSINLVLVAVASIGTARAGAKTGPGTAVSSRKRST